MNLKKVKYIVLLLLTGIFFSCSEEQLNIDRENTIAGKWKLVKMQSWLSPDFYDYSQYNVVFEFREDSTLTVSGKTDQMGQLVIPAGEYLYLSKDYKLRVNGANLFQGKSDFWYGFSLKEVILTPASFNDDMTDLEFSIDGGGAWYFIKTK